MSRALLSVSDKAGLVPFAKRLAALGLEILSTGGTHRVLRENGVGAREVASVTGFPEMMDGRVKTLHPRIHGGILGRRGVDDEVMKTHEIGPIDVVVVNLYPFREVVARPECTLEEAIENIDIGGPAMVRSAAKNHRDVLVVVDPADYDDVALAIERGTATATLRFAMALKAFRHTAEYDAAIADYLGNATGKESA